MFVCERFHSTSKLLSLQMTGIKELLEETRLHSETPMKEARTLYCRVQTELGMSSASASGARNVRWVTVTEAS